MPQKVRIALDAMGGDVGAAVVIPGAAISLTRHPDTEFLLFGDRGRIEEQLARHPAMKAAGGGKVINIGSMLSIFGASFAPAYAASKGGIVQMTKALACAWAKDNIQVNAILPGWIDTPLTQSARSDVPGLNERVLARTPAGRWGKPDDFAGIAVFLASPASDFITGAAIPVDGGYSSQV